MQILIKIEDGQLRSWHNHLAEMLAGADFKLGFEFKKTEQDAPSLESLLALEKMFLLKNKPSLSDGIARLELPVQETQGAPDFIIDLTENSSPSENTLIPTYNGFSGETALASRLLEHDNPKIIIVRNESAVVEAQSSMEVANGLSGALEAVYSRVVLALLKALRLAEAEIATESLSFKPMLREAALDTNKAKLSLGKKLGVQLIKSVYHLCCHSPQWRVGWRHTSSAGVLANQSLAGEAWQVLRDPIDHFYADPFPLIWEDKQYIFFEDLPHRTGKGLLSAVEVLSNGTVGQVIPILEEPWHLSYPFLFEDEGQLWMIPETSASGEVILYRPVDGPLKWERHAVLLSNIEAADVTIKKYRDRYWMFAVTRNGFGGYSDTLSLFYADKLLGPWHAHDLNPVIINPATARPAGAMHMIGDKLFRPVQDCSEQYGGALAIAEVTELSPEAYQQDIHKVLHPNERWPGRRFHTLNKWGPLEVVDGCTYRPKLKLAADIVDRKFEPASS